MFVLEFWNNETQNWARIKEGTKAELTRILESNRCTLVKMRVRRRK